jgi:hypothetical protein
MTGAVVIGAGMKNGPVILAGNIIMRGDDAEGAFSGAL